MKIKLPISVVRLFIQITCVFLLGCLMPGNKTFAQSLNTTRININLNKARLSAALKQIESQTPFKFVYDGELERQTNNITIRLENKALVDVLREITLQTGLEFKQNNRTIAVSAGVKKSGNVKIALTGKVTDRLTGEALPGVTVQLKGLSGATNTRQDGSYTLDIAVESGTLQFSSIGYITQEIAFNGRFVVNADLEPDTKSLNDVVVVGYGTQRKRDLTGAISQVKFKDIKDQPVNNFDQALVGRLPGVQVLQTTGEPGRMATFRVRGTKSLTAGNSPLVVLDGIPLDAGSQVMELVNTNDIASIEVLKDASAAAIYGSRGANGVVIITTKQGSEGRLKVSYSAYAGVQTASKKIDMLNAYQYAALAKDGHDNAWSDWVADGNAPGHTASEPDAQRGPVESAGFYWNQTPAELYPYLAGTPGLTNTDWQDEIFRNAPITNHTLTFTGAANKTQYLVSLNYYDQDGVVINSKYKRYSARVNVNGGTDRFKFGVNFVPTFSTENRINSRGPYSDQTVVASALQMSPTWSVYNADGSYNFEGNGKWRIGKDYQHNEVLNPVALANLIKNQFINTNILGRAFVEYEFISGLSYNASLGGTVKNVTNNYYRPSTLPNLNSAFYLSPSNPTALNGTSLAYNWITDHTLTYKKELGAHHLVGLAGFSAQKNHNEFNDVTATNFANDLVTTINGGQVTSGTAGVGEWSLLSYLGRLQYDYAGKYLFTASIRTDGSSRFGPNNKWGTFPSASAGWRVSSEKFMEKVPVISNLKLRGSYGLTGNFQIGNYEYIALLSTANYTLGGSGGQLTSGLTPSTVSNNNLGWERTSMLDIGLDLGLFNDRLTLEADWYNGNTTRLLLNVPVPLTTGFSNQTQNIGQVNNRGFELALSTQNKFGNFNWNASANFSINRNQVKALGPNNAPIIKTNGTANTFFITQVGSPIGSYYLLKTDGVYRNQQELNSSPRFTGASGSRVGDFRFVDVNGDGVLDVNTDRTVVGNYFPDYTFGVTNNFACKGFDLSVSLQGVQGVEIVNLMRRYINSMEGNFNNTTDALNRWTSEANPGDGLTNRANRKAKGNNGRTSSWHVEDGSYVRLQNVTLGYNLPKSLLSKVRMSAARLYISGQNLITWTKYKGYNPEVNNYDADALTPGVDYGSYPIAKTVALGLNVTF